MSGSAKGLKAITTGSPALGFFAGEPAGAKLSANGLKERAACCGGGGCCCCCCCSTG